MNSITENSLISQLLKRKIVSINEDKPIYNAIKMLAKNNIGALVGLILKYSGSMGFSGAPAQMSLNKTTPSLKEVFLIISGSN